MKKFLILLSILVIGVCAYALDVVYPKLDKVTINSPSTFFIGSSSPNKTLTVNGENVEVHPSGGFAKVVELKYGENLFELLSGDEKLVYSITRPYPKKSNQSSLNTFAAYSKNKTLVIKNDNAPLRSTPIDAGINRMSHLPKGFCLISDGEKNGFNRVVLGKNARGWVGKSYVETSDSVVNPVKIYSYNFNQDNEYYTYTFHLSSPTPWEIIEDKGITVKLFNIVGIEGNVYSKHIDKKTDLKQNVLLGYKAYYDGNDFVVKIRKQLSIDKKSPLSGIKIVLDAGHGGDELGAIGCLGDKEKDINLLYAKDLEKVLKSKGAEVYMTREEDKYLGLYDRVDYTNKIDAPIFISLHANALIDSMDPLSNYGTEIYYYYPQAKPLALMIMNSVTAGVNTVNHGVRQASFAVVRNTQCLSILVEIAYMINPEDNSKLIDKNFRNNIVKALADGIESFLSIQELPIEN